MDKTRKYLTLTCEVCNSEYQQQERLYKKALWKNRCSKHRGEFKVYTCVDCGVNVSVGSERCKICLGKHRRLERPTCADCGCETSLNATRCLSCHNKNQDKGISQERTKFQNSKEWKKARTECYVRDNYTCQVCNTRGSVVLECHHIKSWKDNIEHRLNIDNLLTVCYDCHKVIHFEKHTRA